MGEQLCVLLSFLMAVARGTCLELESIIGNPSHF